MAFPVRTCALIGRFADPRVAETVGALLPHLHARGVAGAGRATTPTLPAASTGVTRVPEEAARQRARTS